MKACALELLDVCVARASALFGAYTAGLLSAGKIDQDHADLSRFAFKEQIRLQLEPLFTRSPVEDARGELVEALVSRGYVLERRALSYASASPAVNSLLADLGDYAREAAEALAKSLPSPRGWQDIETAPKDGTEILAYSAHGGTGVMLVRHIALADFLTDAEGDEYFRQGGSEEAFYEADWFAADFLQGERLSADCYPTHWMPLPSLLESPL